MRPSRRFLIVVLALTTSGLWWSRSPAWAAHRKVDRAIQAELAEGTVPVLRVIVHARPGTLGTVAKQVQALMRGAGLSSKVQIHPALDALTAQVPAARIATLEANPNVVSVSSDAVVRSLGSPVASSAAELDAEYERLEQEAQQMQRQLASTIGAIEAEFAARVRATEEAALEASQAYERRLQALRAQAQDAERELGSTQQRSASAERAARDQFDGAQAAIAQLLQRAGRDRNQMRRAAKAVVDGAKAALAAAKASAAQLTGPCQDAQATARAALQRVLKAQPAESPDALAARAALEAASAALAGAKSRAAAMLATARAALTAAKAEAEGMRASADAQFGAVESEAGSRRAQATAALDAVLAASRAAAATAEAARNGLLKAIARAQEEQEAAATQARQVLERLSAERDLAVDAAESAAQRLVDANAQALAQNRAAFVRQMQQAARDLTASAEGLDGHDGGAVNPALQLLRDAARALERQIAKTPRLRDNALLASLGLTRSTITGYDVGIAVIDSGITPSPDVPVYRAFDFTRAPIAKGEPIDGYGHGTHVAGLMRSTGADALDGTYRGVAPGVRLIDLKVLDATGRGYSSDVVLAIEFAVAMKDTLGIDVINLSLGHPIYEPAATDPLVQAVEMATRAGIVVVASAGNFGRDPETAEVGYAGITSPGNAPSAITVGALDTKGTATRTDDTVAPYSSRGPTWYDAAVKPDLVAPGHHLVADAARNSYLVQSYPGSLVVGEDPNKPNLIMLSGTSMATAVTSGVVALVIEANRRAALETGSLTHLSPNAIKAILQYTAIPASNEQGLPADELTQGAGAVNPAGACELAALIDPAAPAGAPWLIGPVEPVTVQAGETHAWAQRLVWGDRLLWGDSILAQEPAWATRVIWGDRLVWGGRAVFGDRLVWGDSTSLVWDLRLVWGDRVVWGEGLLGDRIDGLQVSGDRLVWGDLASLLQISRTATAWASMTPE